MTTTISTTNNRTGSQITEMLRDVNGLAEKFEETEENTWTVLEDCAEDAMQTIDDFFYFCNLYGIDIEDITENA